MDCEIFAVVFLVFLRGSVLFVQRRSECMSEVSISLGKIFSPEKCSVLGNFFLEGRGGVEVNLCK